MTEKGWGKKLSRARKANGKTQTELAKAFGVRQTTVSRWEADELPIPEKVRKYVRRAEKTIGPGEEAPAVTGTISPEYSYKPATFRRLWAESTKRAERLDVRVDVTPSDSPGFGDVAMELTFRGMVVPRNEVYYSDCIGVSPQELKRSKGGVYYFREDEVSAASLTGGGGRRARVVEEPKAKREVGPYVVGYRISTVDPDDTVQVVIRGVRGVRMEGIECVGVPTHADCPIRALRLCVAFHGLAPVTQLKGEVYLLRRTLVESRPFDLAGGLDLQVSDGKDEEGKDFSFIDILYPKLGYVYCIAWDSLAKSRP